MGAKEFAEIFELASPATWRVCDARPGNRVGVDIIRRAIQSEMTTYSRASSWQMGPAWDFRGTPCL